MCAMRYVIVMTRPRRARDLYATKHCYKAED